MLSTIPFLLDGQRLHSPWPLLSLNESEQSLPQLHLPSTDYQIHHNHKQPSLLVDGSHSLTSLTPLSFPRLLDPSLSYTFGLSPVASSDPTGLGQSSLNLVPLLGIGSHGFCMGNPSASPAEVNAPASAPVGRRQAFRELHFPSGHPTNSAEVVSGRLYTGHGLDRMQGRGFTPSVSEEVINHGLAYVDHGNPGSTVIHQPGNSTTVSVNSKTGAVITVEHTTHFNSDAQLNRGRGPRYTPLDFVPQQILNPNAVDSTIPSIGRSVPYRAAGALGRAGLNTAGNIFVDTLIDRDIPPGNINTNAHVATAVGFGVAARGMTGMMGGVVSGLLYPTTLGLETPPFQQYESAQFPAPLDLTPYLRDGPASHLPNYARTNASSSLTSNVGDL